MVEFTPTVECNGVFHNKNYRIVSCLDGHITFSYAQKGNSMTVHFASDKMGLRSVKKMSNEFCKWIFSKYKWCAVIFAAIGKDKEGVIRMIEKIQFNYIADDSQHHIYSRVR